MIPAQLEEEVRDLLKEGWDLELSESEGMACLFFRKYPLPPKYSKQTTGLLLRLPLSYPNGKPDMFWVETEVLLADGNVPRKANQLETHLGRQWRRFSWHPKSWHPATGTLRGYLEFVNCRLAKGV